MSVDKGKLRVGQSGQNLQRLLKQYAEAFPVTHKELSQTNLVKMTTDTGDAAQIRMKVRPVPTWMRPKLKVIGGPNGSADNRKEQLGVAFPIVLVETKGGSLIHQRCASITESSIRGLSRTPVLF